MTPYIPNISSLFYSAIITLSTPPSTPAGNDNEKFSAAGYTTPKHKSLTIALILSLEDAIVGSERKEDVCFKVVNNYYNLFKPAYLLNRTKKSVGWWVQNILKEFLEFVGCLAKVISTRPYGTGSDIVHHLETLLNMNMLGTTLITENAAHCSNSCQDRGLSKITQSLTYFSTPTFCYGFIKKRKR